MELVTDQVEGRVLHLDLDFWTIAITGLFQEPSRLAEMRAAAIRRSRGYSWGDSATRWLAVAAKLP